MEVVSNMYVFPLRKSYFTGLNLFKKVSYKDLIIRRCGFCLSQLDRLRAKCACNVAILYPFDAVVSAGFRRINGNAASSICIN